MQLCLLCCLCVFVYVCLGLGCLFLYLLFRRDERFDHAKSGHALRAIGSHVVLSTELLRVSECWYDGLIACTRTHHQAPRGDSQVSQRRARSGQRLDREADNRPDRHAKIPRVELPGGPPVPVLVYIVVDIVSNKYRRVPTPLRNTYICNIL